MPYANANGHRLYYEEHGDGAPLLCVMGLGVDVSDWGPQIPALSGRYRTIVFDNRDVGRSSYADSPYAVADMALDTVALIDELELERFHLLGVSLGGAIAQEVALALGDRVLTLTLCVSYAAAGRWASERVRLLVRSAESKSDDELLQEMIVLSLSEATYETVEDMALARRLILSYPYRQRRDGFVRQVEASVRHDVRDRLGALTVPVHVIGAEQDLLVPVWKSRELGRVIPGARLSIMEGVGHRLNFEAAPAFNALVLDFLASAQSQPPPAEAGRTAR